MVKSLCDVSPQDGSMRCSRVDCIAKGLCVLGKVAHAEHVSGVARGHDASRLSEYARARSTTKNSLVMAHLGLVDKCVRALRVHGTLIEDATQDGRLALMRAAESFDAERGTPFGPYARMFVVGAIKACLSSDSMSHCTGTRAAPGDPKPQHVSLAAALGCGVEENPQRDIDTGDIARAAVKLELNLRRAAISMLSGVGSTEHAGRYGISRRTARDHYFRARKALCKMFR